MNTYPDDQVGMLGKFPHLLKRLKRKNVVFSAKFINTTPWWGRGPNAKMVLYIGERKMWSLPTSSTIVGKVRWVMATYLSPYFGMRRQVAERVIADILGSTKASSRYRILVRSRYVGGSPKMLEDTIKNELVAALASTRKRRRRVYVLNEDEAPLPPGAVEADLEIIRRPVEPASELAEDFLIYSVIAALSVYGIGFRANRGYGRFIPTAINVPDRFRNIFGNGVNVESVVELLKRLDETAQKLATYYPHGCDGCVPGLWPVSHVSDIFDGRLPNDILYAIEIGKGYISPGQLLGLVSLIVHFIRKGLVPLPKYPLIKAKGLLGEDRVKGGVLEIFSEEETLEKLRQLLGSSVFKDLYRLLGIDKDSVFNSIASHSLRDKLEALDDDVMITYFMSQYAMGLPERLENLELLFTRETSLDANTMYRLYSIYYREDKYKQAVDKIACDCHGDRECIRNVRKLKGILPPNRWRRARRQSSLVFVPLCNNSLECSGAVLLYHYANDAALLLEILEYVLRNDPMRLEELARRVKERILEVKKRLVGLEPLAIALLKAAIIILLSHLREINNSITIYVAEVLTNIVNRPDKIIVGSLTTGVKEVIDQV